MADGGLVGLCPDRDFGVSGYSTRTRPYDGPVPAPATPNAAPAWRDEGPVDPQWSAPAAVDKRPVNPTVVLLAVLVVLVLLVGLVWRLGGFEERDDVVTDVPVGSTIDTGPYQLRFSEATVQQRTDFKNRVAWRVTAVGEGLTTGTESIAPRYLGNGSMFGAKDPAGGEVQTPQSRSFREGSATFGGAFTPGLPMQPISVSFDFSARYRPGETITFVVYDLDFRDTSLLGNQDPEWANSNHASRLRLPLRVLPPLLS